MISYRHHVVSLVAVFLALAVGVALGGGPFSELGRDTQVTSGQVREQTQEAQRTATFGDDFATASAQALYGDRLRERSVAIVTLPGADGKVVSALGAQVESAGGKVAARYVVQPALVEASEKSLVDTLGSQLMTQLDSGAVEADASTYDRLGQLLGLAVSPGEAAGQVSAADATSIRQTLAGAELLKSPQEAPAAGLVLVVLGADTDDAILSGLLAGLAAKTTGVVVVGEAAPAGSGDLEGLRAEPAAERVATVDGVDTPLGQVTSVLALARSLTVQGGSFGASGSDGAVPLG